MKPWVRIAAVLAIVVMGAIWLTACSSNESADPVISIIAQPSSPVDVAEGSVSPTLTVTATVTEGATLSYQWYENVSSGNTGGTAISGASAASYTLPADLTAGTYYYYCKVSAGRAVPLHTSTVTVTVHPKSVPIISIITQPAATTTVREGEIPADTPLTVEATVTSGATLAYRWYHNDPATDEAFHPIDGATDASYTLPTDLKEGTHSYMCEISVPNETSVNTDLATVLVLPAIIAVTEVTLGFDNLDMVETEVLTLVPTVKPENATDKTVTWESSAPEIVSVEEGKITALKSGTATITVTTNSGGKIAGCDVKVTKGRDPWADGQVITYMKSTKPREVPLILMGDGFTVEHMRAKGRYEKAFTTITDGIFDVEPFKTYRDYFTVYFVVAVSEEEGVSTSSHKVNTIFETVKSDYSAALTSNQEKCYEYAAKTGITGDNGAILLIVNTDMIGGSAGGRWRDGGFAASSLSRDAIPVILHELGHAFAWLADEYFSRSSDEVYPESEHAGLDDAHDNYAMRLNVHYENDPVKVPWAHLIGHPNYSYVGLYEGALWPKGIWRSEPESMMSYQNENYFYNAISREVIVRRIKKIAGEEYSFEEFVAKDKYEPDKTAPMVDFFQ